MIATWMLSALLFTTLLAATAWCAEAALRTARQSTRWPWLGALPVAVTWPVIAPLARRMLRASAEPIQAAATLPSISVPAQLSGAASWLPQIDAVLLTLWATASLIVLVRLVRALTLLARVRRAGRPQVVDGVNVLVSENMGPAVLGIVQPIVLLPALLLDLEEPLRRLILRHEDEHRRAHDPLIVLGSAIAVALVPWNLPLWWITRRARLALEVDCDARVLARDGNATQYGRLLLLIAQRQTVTSLAPMLAAYDTHLERRINAMLPVPLNHRRTKLAAAIIGAIVIGIVACSSRIADIAAPRPEIAKRPAMISADQPYFDFQVEKQVRQVPGTGNLRYPDSLRKANVEGEVLAQFIVGADGKYEAGSLRALRSNHELFTQAVATALPNMLFTPAEIGGARVKQVVQQPFTFALSR
jgi:TonB family protein